MSEENKVEPEEKSYDEVEKSTTNDSILNYYLTEYDKYIIAGLLGTLIYGNYQNWTLGGLLPEFVFVYFSYICFGGIVAYIVLPRFYNKVVSVLYYELFVINMIDDTSNTFEIKKWEIGIKKYLSMSVENGEVFEQGNIIIAEEYDPENNTAKGHFLAELSNLALIERKSSIKNARETLIPKLLQLSSAKSNAKVAAQMQVPRIVDIVIDSLSEQQSINSQSISKNIEDEIDKSKIIDDVEEKIDEEPEEKKTLEELQEEGKIEIKEGGN